MTFPVEHFQRHAPYPDDFIPFDPAEIEGDITARFEKMVDLYPEGLAYEDAAGNRLTYAELDAAANRAAHGLIARAGSMTEVPVAVYCDHGPQQIIAVMGVLKSGGFVVGLDVTHPIKRTLELLTLSQAAFVLADQANESGAAALTSEGRKVLGVEHLIASGPAQRPGIAVSPADYSHLFFTSGSTGQPKGIVHSHRSVLHCMCYMGHVQALHPGDRSAQISPLTFGASILKVYCALLFGGAVVPYDVQRLGLKEAGAWLRDMRLTLLSTNPTVLRQICEYVGDDYSAPQMRVINIGGDALRVTDLALHRRWFPDAALVLNYGSSEGLHIAMTSLNPPHEDIALDAVPSGYVFGQHEVMLVDEDGSPVADGEMGEFAVRSRYLSPGYWRQPKLSAQVFRADPDDPQSQIFMTGDVGRRNEEGLFFHLGRKDSQLKIRGSYRVDPGEVETALLHIDSIREAIVTGHENRRGDLELAAYLVVDEGDRPGADTLRAALSQSLPDYMIPSHFLFLDALPFTTTGKLDRRALPAPRAERPALSVAFAAPRSPLEEKIVKVWAEVLGLDRVGIHDEFFDLGGHSLLATELIARISEDFELRMSFEALFEASTVARMAELIEKLRVESDSVLKPIESLSREEYHMTSDEGGSLDEAGE